MSKLVSIVIPTYNRAQDLERALKSLLAQTFCDWEALIVDNYSKDNTDELIKSFNDPRMKLFKIHNQGVIAASRNVGIKNAKGGYVAFLDSDDWWKPQKLEESLKILENGADIVYHDLFKVTKSKQKFFWKKIRTRELNHPVIIDLISNGNALVNSSVVVRKDILDEINGLSEESSLIAMEDYDAWIRIAKNTDKFKRIPQVLGYYWAGGGNTSNPNRVIQNIEVIKTQYHEIIQNLEYGQNIYWFNYARGRSYYLLGSYELAKENLALIHWKKSPFLIYIKSRWLMMLINWLHSSIGRA